MFYRCAPVLFVGVLFKFRKTGSTRNAKSCMLEKLSESWELLSNEEAFHMGLFFISL